MGSTQVRGDGVSIFESVILQIAFPVIVALFSFLIFFKIFRGKDKTDNGFELNYFKLSYRRKLIRNLISTPIIIVALIVIYFLSNWSLPVYIIFVVCLLLGFCIEALCNYAKWKRDEESGM